ncbi:MAG: DUF6702 family protein [Bacteroidia bacterium]|nr:DUF6702 family protein [Bacteroidia bacterium]
MNALGTALVGIGCFLGLFNTPPHPIHVSLAEVEHTAAGELQISLRIFSDDLDEALYRHSGERFEIGTAQEKPGAAPALEAYLRERFGLRTTQPLAWQWVGYEAGLEATWVYLEVTGVPPFDRIACTNRVLFEVYTDQTSVVNVTQGAVTRSGITRHDRPTIDLAWD